MKVTVLGCGSSGGVPLIGNNWGVCDPKNPRNRRTRVSILVEHQGTSILVDTCPDMRQQLLENNVKQIDAVLYTHAHADHSHGIDELRSVNWMMDKPIDIYADPKTLQDLQNRFPYIFHDVAKAHAYYKPAVTPHEISGAFQLGALNITPFVQDHGYSQSLGYRFIDFAYSTDVKSFDEAAFAVLKGIRTWVVDCVREEEHPTHSHLAQTLEWIARVKPQRAFLTHLNHLMDYETLLAKLPAGVVPAHDGLVIEC